MVSKCVYIYMQQFVSCIMLINKFTPTWESEFNIQYVCLTVEEAVKACIGSEKACKDC